MCKPGAGVFLGSVALAQGVLFIGSFEFNSPIIRRSWGNVCLIREDLPARRCYKPSFLAVTSRSWKPEFEQPLLEAHTISSHLLFRHPEHQNRARSWWWCLGRRSARSWLHFPRNWHEIQRFRRAVHEIAWRLQEERRECERFHFCHVHGWTECKPQ